MVGTQESVHLRGTESKGKTCSPRHQRRGSLSTTYNRLSYVHLTTLVRTGHVVDFFVRSKN